MNLSTLFVFKSVWGWHYSGIGRSKGYRTKRMAQAALKRALKHHGIAAFFDPKTDKYVVIIPPQS